jgi:hypothetical protein
MVGLIDCHLLATCAAIQAGPHQTKWPMPTTPGSPSALPQAPNGPHTSLKDPGHPAGALLQVEAHVELQHVLKRVVRDPPRDGLRDGQERRRLRLLGDVLDDVADAKAGDGHEGALYRRRRGGGEPGQRDVDGLEQGGHPRERVDRLLDEEGACEACTEGGESTQ